MIVERYFPEEGETKAFFALEKMMKDYSVGTSFADMIRYRLAGKAVSECSDTYYIAREGEEPLCRIWMGWGKHDFSVGNWGNFFTEDQARGRGIGKKVLSAWFEDLTHRKEKPLALFCSAATEELTLLYSRYGWRCTIDGEKKGHLYLPLGSSPEKFSDFCKEYYTPTSRLIRKKASVGYRHEIDCLLKFALKIEGISFGIDGVKSIEEILMYSPGRGSMLFTEEGKCVGWSLDGKDQVYPMYESLPVSDM